MLLQANMAGDIRKYFENSYIKLPESGDLVHAIESIRNTSSNDQNYLAITGRTSKGDFFELQVWEEQPYQLDYVLPHKSFFNYKGCAHLLQRVPARQYRRGLCNENTQILRAYLGTGGNCEWENIPLNLDLIQAYVDKPSFPEISAALTLRTCRGNGSIALSRRIALCGPVVLVDSNAVATIKDGKVHLTYPQFKPELSKIFKTVMEVV